MKKLILLATILISNAGIAQLTQRCGTMEHLEMLVGEDPSIQQRLNDNEIKIQQWISENKISGTRDVVTIPVVVHVVWNKKEENISIEQIQSQLDVLNEDYSRSNADSANTPLIWKGTAANSNIQFCLASRDPLGNSTNGIVRVQTTKKGFKQGDKMMHNDTGGSNAWPEESYLNIWVCDLTTNLIGLEIDGFATFPGEASTGEDGVVIDYQAFGTTGTVLPIYSKGRTATHEVGHWLNLSHIWGTVFSCYDGDYVEDTPNQYGASENCPTFPQKDSCTTDDPGIMFMNYMDYSDDVCMNMFTNGQAQRMTATLNTTRASLKSSLGCVEVPPPTNSSIVWQRCIGGSSHEYPSIIIPTNDGGYIVAGSTNSNDGDVWGNHGKSDVLVCKLDSNGIIEWTKSAGGSEDDGAYSILEEDDGSFVVVGFTKSSDGDISFNHGGSDVWIIRLNNLGQILWQKCFGGTNHDFGYSICKTNGSDYVIAATTSSNDYDISFYHGNQDVWILNVTENGDIEWENTYGGSKFERQPFMIKTLDGGYAIAAGSLSSDGDVIGNSSLSEAIWVFKINNSGNMEWQNSLGEFGLSYSFSILELANGDIVVGGYFNGSVQNCETQSLLFTFTSYGEFFTQTCLSTAAYSIDRTNDENLIILGDCTDDNYNNNYSVLKSSLNGDFAWQKCLGGSSQSESGFSIRALPENFYIVTGYTDSNNGDVSGNHGLEDIWIFKLSDSECSNSSIEIVDGPDHICKPDTAILQMTISNATYQWLKDGSPIAGATQQTYTVSKTGDYSCIGSNSICSTTSNVIHINVNKNPSATIFPSGTVTMCAGNSTVLTASSTSTDVTYQWYKGNNEIAGATNATYSATKDGKYKCKITKTSTGCSAYTNKTTINITCRLGNESVVSLYPNPAKDKITIELNYIENVSIQITDATGKKLKIIEATDFTLEFSVADLAQGLYFVNVLEENKLLQVEKFVKQ